MQNTRIVVFKLAHFLLFFFPDKCLISPSLYIYMNIALILSQHTLQHKILSLVARSCGRKNNNHINSPSPQKKNQSKDKNQKQGSNMENNKENCLARSVTSPFCCMVKHFNVKRMHFHIGGVWKEILL